MTLKQLEAFYWAVTCKSYAVAAERVHISISALSKRIGELESSLGCSLVDRSNRRLKVTPMGEYLLPQIRDLLKDIYRLRESATSGHDLQGVCRLGVGEVSSITWVPRMLAALQRTHPNMVVNISVDVGQNLERMIVEGRLDCAVMSGTSPLGALTSHPVGATPFVWIAHADLLKGGQPDPAELFEHHTLITLPPGAGNIRLLDRWLDEHPVTITRRQYCNHWATIMRLIETGQGFGLLHECMAARLVATSDVRVLSHWSAPGTLDYSFFWRRDDSRSLVPEMCRQVVQYCDFAGT